jgi:hypothetical protein
MDFIGYFRKVITNKLIVKDELLIGNKSVITDNGHTYYVDSVNGSATGNGKTWETALTTIDAAINKCAANDTIIVAPAHVETYSTTGAKIIADVVGIKIIGMGEGSSRPTLNFGHTGATITISAANVTIENILFKATVDSVVTYGTISGADCALINVETRDAANVEVIDDFTVTGARLTVIGLTKRGDLATGDANLRVFKMNAVVGANFINCNFLTKVTTAVINFVTAASSNVVVDGCNFLVSGTTNLSKTVVDTITGSTWEVKNSFDLAAGYSFSGGSGASLAGDDVSSVSTNVSTVLDQLSGTTGIATFPNGAVPGNNVSLAEVLRDVWDAVRNGTGGTEPGTNMSVVDEIHEYGGEGYKVSKQITLNGSTSYPVFTVTGLVALKVVALVNTALTNHADTSSLGTTTSAAGLIAATAGTALQTINQIWVDNAPSKFETFPASRTCITESVALASTANIAGGVVTFYAFWKPISSGATVVAA